MKKFFTLLCLLFFLSGGAQDKGRQIDSLLSGLHKEEKFYGNVLIAENGKIIYQGSFGKSDIAAGSNLDAESMFELASVSKQFTAMGIMLLKKQGKLNYDDSLRKYIPGLPYNNITIRHLLNHTSGLPDYMELFLTKWTTARIATNNDMIDLLAKQKPAVHFKPGERWEYSNTGYALLASIIEKVSGIDFGAYLDQHIFKPLEMKRTLVYRRRFEKRKMANYAYGYVYDSVDRKFVLPDSMTQTAQMVYTLDGIVGDGTVNSTTTDLLKWDRALYTEKLLTKAMLAEAFEPGTLPGGKKTGYGFGWATMEIKRIGRVVSHGGGWPGYITFIERHLDTDKTIIILSNYQKPGPSIKKLHNILYGIKEEEAKEIFVSEEKLKGYTGEYELAPGFIITVTTEKGKIFAQATNQQQFEIYPEQDDMFFLKVVEAKLKFVRDEKGLVNSMVLYQNGQEIEGKKIK